MTPQEDLMDSIEQDITRVITEARHKMYERMSQEKPSDERSELKYMVRYYDMKSAIRTKILKPEDGRSIVSMAEDFVKATGYDNTFWIYDGKQNLIYSQIK